MSNRVEEMSSSGCAPSRYLPRMRTTRLLAMNLAGLLLLGACGDDDATAGLSAAGQSDAGAADDGSVDAVDDGATHDEANASQEAFVVVTVGDTTYVGVEEVSCLIAGDLLSAYMTTEDQVGLLVAFDPAVGATVEVETPESSWFAGAVDTGDDVTSESEILSFDHDGSSVSGTARFVDSRGDFGVETGSFEAGCVG